MNYDVQTKSVTEWNVGCERCHGPGGDHVQRPAVSTIVNPAKLDFVRANDTCIQCHSQGQPITNPIQGCHDVHGTSNDADLIKPARLLCLTCHGPTSPNGPHAATREQHTHHQAGSAGSECVACHMPKIEQTIADINVRSHTFEFITPTLTEQFKIPNPCTSCHADKSVEWARETLKGWSGPSPWRMN